MQISSEHVLARSPEVILEIGIGTASAQVRNLAAWSALASVPAVRARRVHEIRGDEMMNPGPRVAQAIRRMAEALHPE
jgi:ABC-type Fe3+-hydroxamate transport system substrate-binding protein